MKKFLFSFLLLGILSSSVGIYANEIPDNTGTAIVEESQQQSSGESSSGSSSLGSEIISAADEMAYENNGFMDMLDTMFASMSKADDGKVSQKTSEAMSGAYGVVVQFVRVVVIIGLFVLSGFDVLAIGLPFLQRVFEKFGSGDRNNSSGSTMGGSSNNQGQGLLSADYYAAIAMAGSGSSSGGGEMGSSSRPNKKNVFLAYTELRFKTLIFAAIAIILLLTPVGFVLVQLALSLILKLIVAVLKGLGGLV